MTRVGGSHGVAEFDGTGPYQQIRERNSDTLRLALPVDLSCPESDRHGYGLYRDAGHEIIEETLAACATRWRVGTSDPVSEFKHRYDGDREAFIASF